MNVDMDTPWLEKAHEDAVLTKNGLEVCRFAKVKSCTYIKLF